MKPDNTFIQRLQEGDNSAYAELIASHSARVLNTCYRFLLDKNDAEDLAQEVFIEVFESVHNFRAEANLSTWIYRIAVTKSLDELKKRKRKKRISSIGKLLHLDDVAHWLTGGSMPDKSIQTEEKMKALQEAMEKLPDSQRVAFTLSKIDGYTNAEIAAIMGTTQIAVESLISRAKQKLSPQILNIFTN